MALTKIDDRGLKTPVDLLDNEKIRFGTGNDLEIYHNGSKSIIADTGTGALELQSNLVNINNAANNENIASFAEDGAVTLYYNHNKKFETTSSGAAVTGNLGIGTTSPDGKLDVRGTIFVNGDGTGGRIFASSGNLSLSDGNGRQILRIDDPGAGNSHSHIFDSNGRLGIGTTSPDTQLHLESNGSSIIRLTDNDTTAENDSIVGQIEFETRDSNATGVSGSIAAVTEDNTDSSAYLQFKTGTPSSITERLRIASDGDLHIGGTARPGVTTSGFTVENNGKDVRWSNGGGTSGTTASGLSIFGGGNSTNLMAATSWGGQISLINTNNTDGNSNCLSFGNSNQLATSFIVGENDSHSNRDGELVFATSDGAAPTEKLRITSSGNVGIGTTSPDKRLEIRQTSAGHDILAINRPDSDTAALTLGNDSSNNAIIASNNSDLRIGRDLSGTFTERMRVTNGGNLLLGTTTTGQSGEADALTIYKNTHTGITIRTGTTHQGSIYFADGTTTDQNYRGTVSYDHSTDSLNVKTAAADRLRIDSTGRITSGKAGVGTSNDAAEWFKVQSNDTAANISIVASNDEHSSLNLGDEDDFNIQKIRSDHTNNSLQFFTSNSERLRIDSSGNVTIQATGADAVRSLRIDGTNGSSETQGFIIENDGENGRLNLKLNSGGGTPATKLTVLPAGGMTFNGDTAAANALDDYEEGTWTPTVQFGGNSTGVTYHGNTGGSYVKIGRQVILHGRIRLSSKGTSTGGATIGGFPFTALNITSGTSSIEGDAYFGYLHDIVSGEDHAHVTGTIDQNATEIKVWWNNDSGDIVQLDEGDFQNGTSVSFGCTYPAA